VKIVEQYSHLNGLEFLLVHKPELWQEIKDVIHDIDGNYCGGHPKGFFNNERHEKSGKFCLLKTDTQVSFLETLSLCEKNFLCRGFLS